MFYGGSTGKLIDYATFLGRLIDRAEKRVERLRASRGLPPLAPSCPEPAASRTAPTATTPRSDSKRTDQHESHVRARQKDDSKSG